MLPGGVTASRCLREIRLGAAIGRERQHLRDEGMGAARDDVLALLASAGPRPYAEIWLHVLQRRHIARTDLNDVLVALKRNGEVEIMGLKPRQRVPDDGNIIGIANVKGGA